MKVDALVLNLSLKSIKEEGDRERIKKERKKEREISHLQPKKINK